LGLFLLEEVYPEFLDRVDLARQLMNIHESYLRKRWNHVKGQYSIIAAEEEEKGLELAETPPTISRAHQSSAIVSKSPFTSQIILQIVSIALQGFLKIATLALVPVFLATPSPSSATESKVRSGVFEVERGFGMNTTNISNVLLSQTIAAIIGQIVGISTAISWQGLLKSFRIGHILLFLIYCTIASTAGTESCIGVVAMLVILWIYALANGLATTCSAILYVNALLSSTKLMISESQMQHLHQSIRYYHRGGGFIWLPREDSRSGFLWPSISSRTID
jgi:predicted small integral membrane protein